MPLHPASVVAEQTDFRVRRHARDRVRRKSRGRGLGVRAGQRARFDLKGEEALGLHEGERLAGKRLADDRAAQDRERDDPAVVLDRLDGNHAAIEAVFARILGPRC
jgi:hypothetical protein